ncbi:hypothetical protein L9F63_026030, partial [Diploptera punctata]
MRRVFSGHLAERPGEKGEGQSIPSQLLYVHGVSQTTKHGGGTLCAGRQQIHLQRGLHLRQNASRNSDQVNIL